MTNAAKDSHPTNADSDALLFNVIDVIDRVRTGTTTVRDAEFLESELLIPQSLRGKNVKK
jgi:hypothetical protein